ncbi:DUF4148 domain-containing protein [Burkholderia sp. IMCC1007]|uniref:DUF4148 domain-containing protein n=1 Tax=Burkholderia sp. IMCC1007 TaxID=3004104 RepID=UPI0022B2B46C|nr:DUF4148 domain-containing protein [Burkholderia sp. IMCC1007]
MKSFVKMSVIAALVAVPVVSFAQSTQPQTLAELIAELAQLRKAGYDPQDWAHYPENLRAAQAKVESQNSMAQGDASGYGRATGEASRSGSATGM